MSDALRASRVATVSRPGLGYVEPAPFDPPNPVYAAVEAVLALLGLDRARAGTPGWNPLGDLVAPGGRVIVKPNLVSSRNLHERIEGAALAASSTHGSVLRPILDYALRAVGPHGHVTVADCPVEGCELDRVTGPLGIQAVIEELCARGQPVRLLDLRRFWMAPCMLFDDVRLGPRSLNLGLLVRRRLPGDPRGYRTVDLGEASCFARSDAPPPSALRFHRSHYTTPVPHHQGGRHAYCFGQSVLDADAIVNLPKLKTHQKTGVTLALKSAVGLTSEKYWLPHFTAGDPSMGGDEHDRALSLGARIERKLSRLPLPGGHSLVARAARPGRASGVLDGAWEGNDTLWRTIVDLNRALFFADRRGQLRAKPQRRMLSIVDGIVAGEGEGPLGATPVAAGLLVGGCDPGLVDHCATAAMGIDPALIPTTMRWLELGPLPSSQLDRLEQLRDGPAPEHRFRTPRSWPSLARV